MSFKMFYEDGQGEILDENGTEAMDWDEEVDNPYRTQTLTSLQEWQSHQIVYEPETRNLQNQLSQQHPSESKPRKIDNRRNLEQFSFEDGCSNVLQVTNEETIC
ncbi:hypothetical protein INT48_005450 [Thamnidium elegans]|uniref:Uncharacterized protein n=1 Tax=Thamnidium elegans TaxID=101142 RepID=A0A8H7SNS8_9FUNG|nr:hypothetical protein INT48_005450 [Thamnidium elegans]